MHWAQVWWQYWANGNARIKPEDKITPAEVENYNLILNGNAPQPDNRADQRLFAILFCRRFYYSW
tara:strand:+ start:224 stop:418 length:195 start_codon:yes stop_codon:yes gene_type:complete